MRDRTWTTAYVSSASPRREDECPLKMNTTESIHRAAKDTQRNARTPCIGKRGVVRQRAAAKSSTAPEGPATGRYPLLSSFFASLRGLGIGR